MQSELTPDDFRFTPPRLSPEALQRFLHEHWGVTGSLQLLSGERDQNFRVVAKDNEHYVLKTGSPVEDPLLVDFQVQALLHLQRTDPGLPVPHLRRSQSDNAIEVLATEEGDHPVRLLSWIDGDPMQDHDHPPTATIEQIGRLQGRICKAFRGFEHAGAAHFMPWNILNDLVLSQELRTRYLPPEFQERCATPLHRLERESLPAMKKMPAQVIHNDAHGGNVMCDPDDPHRITGVIDFGDLIRAPLVVDLATSLANLFDCSATPLDDAAALVRGFTSTVSVPDDQIELLYDATLARSIMVVELLEFRMQNTKALTSLTDADLYTSRQGLERALRIDPGEFLEVIRN